MSDLGVLSHHYKASADLAKELNQAVVALKKQFYGLVGGQDIPADEMASYRRHLVSVLNTLLAEFAPVPKRTSQHPPLSIPASIVERIRQTHRGTMAHYVEDLMSTRGRLSQDGKELNERDIELLDELAATAGLDTAEVFRRMWRKCVGMTIGAQSFYRTSLNVGGHQHPEVGQRCLEAIPHQA